MNSKQKKKVVLYIVHRKFFETSKGVNASEFGRDFIPKQNPDS